MKQYLELLDHILLNGEERKSRAGDSISVFGHQTRYDLRKEFPAVTTKKLAFQSVVSELLWFISGSSNERDLCKILHDTTSNDKKTIWSDNANADYWKGKYPGDLGRIYGVQWRHWQTFKPYAHSGGNSGFATETDQLTNLIEGIKNDPYSRRHIMSSWNPGELEQMALPPCHVLSQFYVNNKGELSCQLYQRSNDVALGGPFNIASYALLTHMIAQVTGLKVGEFVHSIGDAHIYLDQIDGVKEQLSRTPLEPTAILKLNKNIKNINDFTMKDIVLENYEHLDPIKFPMAV